jgi:hypothetical protein
VTAVRTVALIVLGIAIPATLVAGVYLASAGPLADVPAVVAVPANKVAAPIPIASTTTTTKDDHGGNDRPGKCDEKEHELDPECDPPRRKHRSESSGSSGSGSGSSSSSSSGSSSGTSSGSSSGSGGGGSGGGDDDESEHGGSGHDD